MSDKKTLAQRLVQAMRSIDAITKNGKNERQGYAYVKATDVANEVRKSLGEQGIAFTYSVKHAERWEKTTNGGGTLFFCQITAAFRFIDQDSGESLEVDGLGWGADSLDKAPYKAMTGALKYALRMNFLIPDEEDPEKPNDLYEDVVHRQHKPVPMPTRSVPMTAERYDAGMREPGEDTPMFDQDGELIEHPSAVQNREKKQAPVDVPSTRPASGPKISEPQAKRFLAIAKSGGKSWPEIDSALHSIGIEKATEIPRDQYSTFIEWAGGSNSERRA